MGMIHLNATVREYLFFLLGQGQFAWVMAVEMASVLQSVCGLSTKVVS